MIVIIAGGRSYIFKQDDLIWLDQIHGQLGITGVVTGGAHGADAWGQRWAEDLDIPVKVFRPDWERHGMAAGPKRNKQMADFLLLYPRRAVLLFPGGKGTASMKEIAQQAGIPIYEYPGLLPITYA